MNLRGVPEWVARSAWIADRLRAQNPLRQWPLVFTGEQVGIPAADTTLWRPIAANDLSPLLPLSP